MSQYLVDWDAVDELHHQERSAPLVRPTIEKTTDVRMLQLREDLAFAVETLPRLPIGERQRQQLEGDLLFEGAIVSLGQIDSRHAAAGDFANDAIRTETSPCGDRRIVGVVGLAVTEGGPRLRHASAEVDRQILGEAGVEQPFHVRRERSVAGGHRCQERLSAIRLEIQSLVEDPINLREAIGRSMEHGDAKSERSLRRLAPTGKRSSFRQVRDRVGSSFRCQVGLCRRSGYWLAARVGIRPPSRCALRRDDLHGTLARRNLPTVAASEASARRRLAEREGFEPSVEFPLHTLSKRAPSTTRTSLRLESTTSGN